MDEIIKRPWNENIESRAFWDPNHNNGQGREFSVAMSLKDRLTNPSGMKIEHLMIDLAQGVVMTMEAIDQMNKPQLTKVVLEDGYVYESGFSHQIEPEVYGLFSSYESALDALSDYAKHNPPIQCSANYWSFGDYYIRRTKVNGKS